MYLNLNTSARYGAAAVAVAGTVAVVFAPIDECERVKSQKVAQQFVRVIGSEIKPPAPHLNLYLCVRVLYFPLSIV